MCLITFRRSEVYQKTMKKIPNARLLQFWETAPRSTPGFRFTSRTPLASNKRTEDLKDNIFKESIFLVVLPCWSIGTIQMRPLHSPCQGWPLLHQLPPAMWPAVHPGTQSQRVHWRTGGRRAGSLFLRSHRHTYRRRHWLNFLFMLWVHLWFNMDSTNIHQKIFMGLCAGWYWKSNKEQPQEV